MSPWLPSGRVFEGDLYGPLPAALRGKVDVLAVNAPYVPTDAIDATVVIGRRQA